MTTDRLLTYANGAYLLCVIFAALFSVVLWRLSTRASEEANVQIAAADSRAANANRLAADAGREAANANERAAALEKAAAEARERTAQAEERIAHLNLEMMKIKAPRSLSYDDINEIIPSTLNRFTGQHFRIATSPGSMEAEGFTNIIASMLIRSGWIQSSWNEQVNSLSHNENKVGKASVESIVIAFPEGSSEEIQAAAAALVYSLRERGIACFPDNKLSPDNNSFGGAFRIDEISIIVGPKPI